MNPKTEVSKLFSDLRNYEQRSDSLKKAAVDNLVKLGKPAVESLIESLSHNPAELQVMAIEALGRIGGTNAETALIAALGDAHLKKYAISALGNLQSRASVEHLIKAYDDDKWWIRVAVLGALKDIKDKSGPVVDFVLRCLNDTSWEVRRSAAETLGALGEERVVMPLINALSDGFAGVRESAASALGELGDLRAVEPLIGVLKDERSDVRGNAAWSLSKLGDKRAVGPLIGALKDINWWVRSAAAYSLGELGGNQTIEPLIKALDDRDKNVRNNAIKSLEKLTNKSFENDKFLSTASPLFTPLRKYIGISFGEAANKWQDWWKTQHRTSATK